MTGIGMLLEHQLAACRDADGNIDMARLMERVRATYAEMYRERTRTQRVIQVMGEEVEELTSALEKKIEARTAEALALRARFGDALDCVSQGILLVGHDGLLLNANRAARDLLGLDEGDFEGRTRFLDLMARLHQAGEFGLCFGCLEAGGVAHAQAPALGKGLHRRGRQLVATAGRARRLGIDGGDLVASIKEGAQHRHGEIRGAHENQAQPLRGRCHLRRRP